MRKALVQYRKTANAANSRGQILLKLYDGAIRFLEQAKVAMAQNRPDLKGTRISKAHAIISELNATLNHDISPELCANLSSLYRFMLDQLTEANRLNSPEPLDVTIELLDSLRGAWREAVKTAEGSGAPVGQSMQLQKTRNAISERPRLSITG